MDIRVNSQQHILASFSAWLPMVVVIFIAYGALSIGVVIWVLSQFFGVEQNVARQVGVPLGGMLVVAFAFVYLKWLMKSLADYSLSLTDGVLSVKGISGRRTIENALPISEIKKIHIGTHNNTMEKPASGQRGAKSKAASRMMFILKNGDYFKLDFAMNAFDNASLYEFLAAIKRRDIEVNIRD